MGNNYPQTQKSENIVDIALDIVKLGIMWQLEIKWL